MYIGNKWDIYLREEYSKPYFRFLMSNVNTSYEERKVLPDARYVFKAFQFTDFHDVKCVILGQDPYPAIGVACGLAFSVQRGVKIPASLNNIFMELVEDVGIPYPKDGNLVSWASQGVLLLNSILTVNAGHPGSHKDFGWQGFTDEAIRQLSDHKKGIAFLLWGKFAQSKSHLIDHSKHLVLETSHPSPHSVHLGFRGCKHFSKVNEYLKENGTYPIDWTVR